MEDKLFDISLNDMNNLKFEMACLEMYFSIIEVVKGRAERQTTLEEDFEILKNFEKESFGWNRRMILRYRVE